MLRSVIKTYFRIFQCIIVSAEVCFHVSLHWEKICFIAFSLKRQIFWKNDELLSASVSVFRHEWYMWISFHVAILHCSRCVRCWVMTATRLLRNSASFCKMLQKALCARSVAHLYNTIFETYRSLLIHGTRTNALTFFAMSFRRFSRWKLAAGFVRVACMLATGISRCWSGWQHINPFGLLRTFQLAHPFYSVVNCFLLFFSDCSDL